MSTLENTKPFPIEVWLTKKNMVVTCRVVHEDESIEELGVDSLSMRGAQRYITGRLISEGYKPVGRWENHQDSGDDSAETSRTFKLDPAQG